MIACRARAVCIVSVLQPAAKPRVASVGAIAIADAIAVAIAVAVAVVVAGGGRRAAWVG